MQRKLHMFMLLGRGTGVAWRGTGCDKLQARDHLNKGVNAYKIGAVRRGHRGFQDRPRTSIPR